MQNRTFDEWIEDFKDYRVSCELSTTCLELIKTFRNWCRRNYPEEMYLQQEMIDRWGTKRVTENISTQNSRASNINQLIEHINLRGGNFNYIEYESGGRHTVEARVIGEKEFRNVLRAADELSVSPNVKSKYYIRELVLALEMPVVVRLLYSSGIRPPEARLLERSSVDLENGILYVRKGKGYKERIVALDPGMNELLRKYDGKMDAIFPNRGPFFPNENGNFRSRSSYGEAWRKMYDKYNDKPAEGEKPMVIYCLRHTYTTRNIERLPQDGYQKDIKVLALSRSLGHENVSFTIDTYYHLTPRSSEIFDEKMSDTFDQIIPDID